MKSSSLADRNQRSLDSCPHVRLQFRLRLLLLRSVLVGSISAALMGGLDFPVQAYTTEDLLTVYRVEGEDYNALVRRAEVTARSSAQQKFDRDILLTRVVITVLGQNGGQLAPILVMDVNRNDWRNRPDPQYWAKYYRSTRVLLELDGVAPVQPASIQQTPIQPTPVPVPAPPDANGVPAPSGTPPTSPTSPNQTLPNQPGLLPSGAASPPSINIPATPPGQVRLPRSILR